jgi:hypothetical protein
MNRGSISIFLSLLMLTTAAMASGPAPAYIPIQGYLTDADERPLDGEHVLHLKLYSSDTAETALYEESQIVLLDRGYFTVYLGMNKPLSLELVRDSDGLVLGFAVDSDPEMTPRLTLGTTPYAAYAKYTEDAQTLEGKNASDFRLAADPVDWTELDNVPTGMEDGDSDTLMELSCAPGQVSKRAEDTWVCADDSVLTQTDVEAMVAGIGYARTSDLAAVAFSGSFADLAGTPAEFLDGDNDTLAGLSCVSGQSAAFNGTSWVCSNRARDTLTSLSCADGQTAKWNFSQSAWICDADIDTTLTEADVLGFVEANDYAQKGELSWIALSGSFEHLLNVPAGLDDGDDDALGHLLCAAGQVPKWGPAGWMCAFDQDTPGDITHVTAGIGLDGGGDVGAVTLMVDPAYVQVRVTGTCPAGESVREIDENGDVTCEKDTLDNMLCSDGAVPKRVGTNWVCGDDADSLTALNCASGQVLKRSGNVWTCAEDQIFSGTLSCNIEETIANGTSASVSCPAGSMATGGGGDCVNDLIITSSPSGNGWRIHCQTSQANIKVWAVCCTLQ